MKDLMYGTYQGVSKGRFEYGKAYKILVTDYWLGNKVRVQAVRHHNSVKPIVDMELVYPDVKQFGLEWHLHWTKPVTVQPPRVRNRRDEDE
jgi:hypothetical protein